ncbi:unnamed protein product, partial [Rotaria sp. Silwood2]
NLNDLNLSKGFNSRSFWIARLTLDKDIPDRIAVACWPGLHC